MSAATAAAALQSATRLRRRVFVQTYVSVCVTVSRGRKSKTLIFFFPTHSGQRCSLFLPCSPLFFSVPVFTVGDITARNTGIGAKGWRIASGAGRDRRARCPLSLWPRRTSPSPHDTRSVSAAASLLITHEHARPAVDEFMVY